MADKKRLFQPQLKEKWLFGMEPLEPIPMGPHCKRWYRTKNKLPPSSLAKHRHRPLKYSMDSRWWISMRKRLDDFGTGFPRADNLFICGRKEGFLSMTAHRVPQPPPRKTQKKLPKEAELLSRLSLAQQAGKVFVEELKDSLASHPLTCHPDLKKILPADFLLNVLEETDPDKKLGDSWAYCEDMKDRKKSSTKLCEKHPEEVNLEPSEPSQPGTSQPSQPGTSQPSQPGTSQPNQAGTSQPSQPGPPNQVKLGPPSQVNQDLPSKSTWDLPANSTGDLLANSTGDLLNKSTGNLLANSTGDHLAKLTRDLPSKSTRDLPAKLTWEQLVKSSWDLLAKSSRNSRPSQPVPPGQVNRRPPKHVNRRLPKQVKWGPLKQVTPEPPDRVNQGPPNQCNRRFPGQIAPRPPSQVTLEPPDRVNQGCPNQRNRSFPGQVAPRPPSQVTPGPPDRVNQGPSNQCNRRFPGQVAPRPPSQVTPGGPDQVNQRHPKDSFLSYLMKLFPEEKKKKKSSRKVIPQNPDPYRYVEDEASEFCTWIDTFEDMDIDEKFIMEQFEIDEECIPNDNMGKIKKVTQIPMELYYSEELDDIKKIEFALQEGNWERDLRKPPDPYRPKWVKRYGEWYLNPKTSKKQINDEPWVGFEHLKEQKNQSHARDLEPDILDDLYGPIAFKDFIVSKGYRMPGVIEKLFLRKKWSYDSVKTPIDRVMKLLSKVPDDTSEDD